MKYMAICPDICDETMCRGDSPEGAAFELARDFCDSFDAEEFDLTDGPYDFEIWNTREFDLSRSGEFLARYFFREVVDHLSEDIGLSIGAVFPVLDWSPCDYDKDKLGAFERSLSAVVEAHFPKLARDFSSVWDMTTPLTIIRVWVRDFMESSTFRYEITSRKPGKQADDTQPAKA